MTRSDAGSSTAVLVALCVASFAASASAQLETRASFPLMSEPQSVAVGDFNHDGKIDLAVASLGGTDQVSVLLGNGDGTFHPAVNYAVGGTPQSLVVADLRRDGTLDLVTATSGGTVSVLLGNGDGTFQPPQEYATAPGPEIVGVGDFNGDHIPDILVLETSGVCHCISVLLGNGDGTFQVPPITISPSFPPVEGGIGDFNGDGKLDVATAGCSFVSCEVNILLGNGDGSFHQGATYSVPGAGSYLFPVVVADLRGNGELDLAFTATADSVAVLLGNGDGTFGQPAYYPTNLGAALVAAADLNGDGKLDLIVISGNYFLSPPAAVGVLLGNSDGTFQPQATYPVGKEPSFAAAEDFNGDGQQDLAVLDSSEGNVAILLNTGVVSFSPTTPLTFAPQLIGTTSAALGVTLTNTGATLLSIGSISVRSAPSSASGTAPASQPFSLTSNCGKSVPASGSCNVNVCFRPQTLGQQNAIISIVDSASSKPQVIELSGEGTVVKLSPAQLSFPPQKAGTTSHPMTVQLTNTSSKALHISAITRGGVDPSSFKEQNTCGSQVAAGASCTISVVFAPNQPGSYQAVVNISDNGGGTQFVPLSGTGTS